MTATTHPLEGEYVKDDDSRTAVQIYCANWYENWNVLRALLNAVSARHPDSELKREYTALSDIYHALGATRLSVVAAWAATWLYNLPVHHEEVADGVVQTALASVAITLSALGVFIVLHRTRTKTARTAEQTLRLGLHWFLKSHPNVFQPVTPVSASRRSATQSEHEPMG